MFITQIKAYKNINIKVNPIYTGGLVVEDECLKYPGFATKYPTNAQPSNNPRFGSELMRHLSPKIEKLIVSLKIGVQPITDNAEPKIMANIPLSEYRTDFEMQSRMATYGARYTGAINHMPGYADQRSVVPAQPMRPEPKPKLLQEYPSIHLSIPANTQGMRARAT